MRNKHPTTSLLFLAILCLLIRPVNATTEREHEVKQILERMETQVLAFRDEMERVYADRCSLSTLSECGKNNYDDCTSVYPDQVCLTADQQIISECGSGEICNALWSTSVSHVRIPEALARGPNGNPTDPELIETVCYSNQAEKFMIDAYEQMDTFWEEKNSPSSHSWSYFGAHNGIFRIHPSTHKKVCGKYDPRRRPWYVAAGSGPKDVVIVVDKSGSMEQYERLELAIEAAKTVIDTLTVADRVAVVPFSDRAGLLGGQDRLIRATKTNKDMLIKALSRIEARGSTNFYSAFSKTFNVLDQTIREEASTGCNIAILFLTDGQITEGPDKEGVINLVNTKTSEILTRWKRKSFIFTYSLGIDADHEVTKAIACNTGGLWAPVDDLVFGGDLVSSMASYYKLFAMGLGEGDNSDFVAWVEPYKFFTGNDWGTTVSAPVYDRSVEPKLFLGVVGIDIRDLHPFVSLLGEEAGSASMLDRFVRLSTARCPKLNLTECELDALRYLGGGKEAMCGSNGYCDTSSIVPKKCRGVSDYPRNLWVNNDVKQVPYEDRACCEIGTNVPSDMCPDIDPSPEIRESSSGNSASSAGIIVGVAAAALGVGIMGGIVWKKSCKVTPDSNQADARHKIPNVLFTEQTPVAAVPVSNPTVVVLPPPSNPSYDGS